MHACIYVCIMSGKTARDTIQLAELTGWLFMLFTGKVIDGWKGLCFFLSFMDFLFFLFHFISSHLGSCVGR